MILNINGKIEAEKKTLIMGLGHDLNVSYVLRLSL